ncbi:MAG: PAS domain-containing sensor histidine kinase, partial [Planctomycetaceae bacterium]|nr:PAS domain-containing sensor histidine kinase [Planctomycetaceae bacterium]
AFCQTLNDFEGKEIGNVLQLRDVTERVLVDDRMRRMERYLGLGSLAGGLHHEIKNPLAALSLHVQLLEEQIEERDPSDETLRMLGVIKKEVHRIGDVLQSFQDFASIGRLNLGPVNLPELIQRQVKLVRPRADQRKVTIHIEPSAESLPTIEADQTRLEQVLLNLILNSMEAMPEGGEVTISAQHADDVVHLEVSDTGPGVPDDLRDRIFDPYFTTKSEGTGLGLALCDKIMRQHQGGLDYRSTDRGATFRLTLPLHMKNGEA